MVMCIRRHSPNPVKGWSIQHPQVSSVQPFLSMSFTLWLLAWFFCGTPTNGSRGVSGSFTCSWDPFPPTGLASPAVIWGFVPSFTAPCVILFPWCPCFISKGKQKTSGSRRVGGGEDWEEWRMGVIVGEKNKLKNKSSSYVTNFPMCPFSLHARLPLLSSWTLVQRSLRLTCRNVLDIMSHTCPG